MKDLEIIRKEIIETDFELARLFKKRMYLAKEVALYKKENALPIFDEKREEIVRKHFVASVGDETLAVWAENLITEFMKCSKEFQAAELGLTE